MRTFHGEKQQSIQRSSLVTKKAGELTAMKTNMHAGPQPDMFQEKIS